MAVTKWNRSEFTSNLCWFCFVFPASFAPICFAIKSKENDMLPLEKNRVRLDDDSDEDKGKGDEREGAEPSATGVEQQSDAPPPQPEEKKPTLSQEELEAKQGGVTTHNAQIQPF